MSELNTGVIEVTLSTPKISGEMEIPVRVQGLDGKSAYEVAVANGYTGTQSQWISSLKGEKGDTGVYVGTEEPVDGKIWIDLNGAQLNTSVFAQQEDIVEATNGIKDILRQEYYKATEVDAKIAQAQLDDTDVDLSGYYTKTEIDNKHFLTSHQSLVGYATKDYVDGVVAAIPDTDLSAYTKTVDLANVATSGNYEDLNNKPIIPSITGLASELWVEAKGYALASQIPDVSGFQTAQQVQTAITTALSAIGVAEEGTF